MTPILLSNCQFEVMQRLFDGDYLMHFGASYRWCLGDGVVLNSTFDVLKRHKLVAEIGTLPLWGVVGNPPVPVYGLGDAGLGG